MPAAWNAPMTVCRTVLSPQGSSILGRPMRFDSPAPRMIAAIRPRMGGEGCCSEGVIFDEPGIGLRGIDVKQ